MSLVTTNGRVVGDGWRSKEQPSREEDETSDFYGRERKDQKDRLRYPYTGLGSVTLDSPSNDSRRRHRWWLCRYECDSGGGGFRSYLPEESLRDS